MVLTYFKKPIQDSLDGLDWQENVKSRFDPTSALPSSPSEGDRYLSTATANGWISNHIYEYRGTAWADIPPDSGMEVWVEDESKSYQYRGTAWSEIAIGADPAVLKEPTGFPNRTDTSLSFTDINRTLLLTRVNSNFKYYIKGVEYVKTENDSVAITDTEGVWYIYYSGSTLTASQTAWSDFSAVAPVAILYWDANNKKHLLLSDERHGCVMDGDTHAYLHLTVGARYDRGFAISGYTPTTQTDAAVQFGIEGGTIRDEDIAIAISHSAAPSAPFEQKLNDPAEIPVWYRSGASAWRKDTATTFAFKNTTSGRVNYNQLITGSWGQTETPDNNFVAYWIFATNSQSEPVVSIQGQRFDTSIANARANNLYESLVFGDFPFKEAKLLYRVILRTRDTYTGTRKCTIEDVVDFRTVSNLPSGTYVATSHSSLSGLTNLDHPASAIRADTTNFDGLLTATEDTVQKALDKINDLVGYTAGYTHTQSSEATVWTVNHNLGNKYLNVTCYDSSDSVIIPESIVATSTTQTTITFSSSRTGKAVLTVAATAQVTNTYLHTQSAANTTWTVTHNLNSAFPMVMVYDSNSAMIIPDTVTATDVNTVTLTFNVSLTGKCSVVAV